ncbi:carbohydrate-binding family 9-like protein [Mangrovibacterium lignilyticum]|uniref:carbohydrate-binding family 9-like protein n=1 Tax=Mangrovibacterium lignilyticum TaxID=2668052 RepID=UPI0013D064F6|nr:carbohydrate-binding family 9-like protein [Mangrovibacterium lignilyticum]
MNKILSYTTIITLAFWANTCLAQSPWSEFGHLFLPVENYVAYQLDDSIQIDGVPNEASWAKAEWSDDFVDIEGNRKPKPLYRTRLKMLWDEQNLYILAEMEEPDIWAYYQQRDLVVFHENDFELFVDPDGDGLNYFEYEVNAQNTLFDLFLPKSYRSSGKALISYNSLDFESAVSIDGSLNEPTDTDNKWTVELKIPFADLSMWGDAFPPKNGEQWRINFSRVNWQTEAKDGQYTKKINPATGKSFPEYNWVWSAPGIISMHAPERYGLLQFSTNKVGERPVAFSAPADQQLRDCCWLVFYKQQAYQSQHKKYAQTLDELGIPDSLVRNGQTFKLKLSATPYQFTILVTAPDGQAYAVNNDGYIHAIQK